MNDDAILCMFSGGIDSAGVLHQLFTNPEFQQRPLIVHHIYLQNRENRAQAEMDSVTKIFSFYKMNYPEREFTYTSSIFNTNGFAPLKANRFPFDVDVCAFVAGNICVARKDIRQVATGRTKTDIDSGDISYQKRIQRAQAVFHSLYCMEVEAVPEYIFPVANKTKKEIWNELPQPVQAACWYCRKPQYAEDGSASKCGHCKTCKQTQEFIDE
ncbi:MAG: 7-cyano-7-deazaguanine synthase in queuosine biosynthesis [Cryomorphaceae bacterium]|jgi:7-cyano-7-deazaguanine synthase in queuosine biosynthesis